MSASRKAPERCSRWSVVVTLLRVIGGRFPRNDDPCACYLRWQVTLQHGPTYPGIAKFIFGRRLGDSWHDLADLLGVPRHERDRFPRGHEAGSIWEWLADREWLSLLPGALETIGRADLADELSDRMTVTVTGAGPGGSRRPTAVQRERPQRNIRPLAEGNR
jgi:hypothetical protein